MEIYNYPLTCWWNGEIVIDGENVTYKGGCETFIIVNSNIGINELKNEIYDAMEVDKARFDLNVKMKFPSVRGYKVLALSNDRGLKAMWASVCQSKAPSMDLYIELTPIEQPNMSFTNMLVSQVEDPNWFVSLSTNNVDEASLDGNIEGDEIEDEDDMLLLSQDEDSGVDLVSLTDHDTEFTKLHSIDEEYLNSWYNSSNFQYKSGGEFEVGQEFANKKALGQIVTTYNVERNQVYKTTESKPHTVTFKCGRKPIACSWYLRASQKNVASDVFTIVTYKGPHENSCVVHKPSMDHPNLKREFISNAIKPLVQADWGVKVSVLKAFITKEFNFTISYGKAWSAKQKAIGALYGDWEESYQYLPRYMEALKEANPGTVVHFVNKPTHDPYTEQFHCVFWAFGPSIRGFQHCRPIITIDGTHLYGKYRGVMLIAMGVDANDQIFPLAFAIVEKEDHDNWSWFLACIRCFVTKRHGLCVISDRHAGILSAMSTEGSGWEEPYAFHRFCIRHHASNIQKTFKNTDLKKMFTNTAMEHQIRKFDKGMQKIGALNPRAKSVLEGIPLSKWSLAHDGGLRYGIKTSNLCECFNGVLKGVRFLPIQALVKATFTRVNKYFVDRREVARNRMRNGMKWSEKITVQLERNSETAAHHEVTCFNIQEGIYGVVTRQGNRHGCMANRSHTLNLSKRTCTCNKWQNLHYPCSHLIAVCRSHSIDTDQYVDPLFSCGEYFGSYRACFLPVPDEDYWKTMTGPVLVVNPAWKRGKGRPKSKRIRNEMDELPKTKVTCSLCNVPGHNKRSCPLKQSNLPGPSR